MLKMCFDYDDLVIPVWIACGQPLIWVKVLAVQFISGLKMLNN